MPQKTGLYQLSASLVIFNPDSSKYVTLSSRPFPVNVRPGTGEEASPNYSPDDQTGISPPLSTIDFQTPVSSSLLRNPISWLALSFPFLFVTGLFFYRKKQNQKNDIDPVLRKQQQARQEALKRLTTAETFRQQGKSKSFYDEVEKALLGYIGDKLQIERSQMTKSNVESQLNKLNVENEKVTQFMGLLKICEMALYAGKDNAESMQTTYDQTISLVSEIEAFLN